MIMNSNGDIKIIMKHKATMEIVELFAHVWA